MIPAYVYMVSWEHPGEADHPHATTTTDEDTALALAVELADTPGMLWVTVDRLAVLEAGRLVTEGRPE